ncbi:hypothetical protein V9T40_006736 [Parthenolecanium corni]|uniref:Uncharacterized protein n=1 Tax=Parthenolecanium corni TaxID=536013 RepID=A0AAN9Y9J6_9HEMI
MTKTNNTPEDGARLNAVCRTGGDSVAKSIGLCIENGERERMRAEQRGDQFFCASCAPCDCCWPCGVLSVMAQSSAEAAGCVLGYVRGEG